MPTVTSSSSSAPVADPRGVSFGAANGVLGEQAPSSMSAVSITTVPRCGSATSRPDVGAFPAASLTSR
jgi:hypothetical protein